MADTAALYAGFAGVTLQPDEYDLGNGLMLSRTYAHVMAPFVAAFKPAPPGKPHPAPWRAAGGGVFTDIHVQLSVPSELPDQFRLDRSNTAWLISALITLKITPRITVPVLSNLPFPQVSQSTDDPVLRPMELMDHPLIPEIDAPTELTPAELVWVRSNWLATGQVAHSSSEFNLALQGFYYSTRTSSPPLALLSLWALLEELFGSSLFRVGSEGGIRCPSSLLVAIVYAGGERPPTTAADRHPALLE